MYLMIFPIGVTSAGTGSVLILLGLLVLFFIVLSVAFGMYMSTPIGYMRLLGLRWWEGYLPVYNMFCVCRASHNLRAFFIWLPMGILIGISVAMSAMKQNQTLLYYFCVVFTWISYIPLIRLWKDLSLHSSRLKAFFAIAVMDSIAKAAIGTIAFLFIYFMMP